MGLISSFKFIFMPVLYAEQKLQHKIKVMYWFRDHHMSFMARIICDKIYRKHNCIIGINSSIHPSVRFPHPVGIVVGDGAEIRRDTVVFQNVTIGAGKNNAYPVIGAGCKLYPNSVIVGSISVADGTIVGALCFLNKDTVSNGVYAGVPGTLLKKSI